VIGVPEIGDGSRRRALGVNDVAERLGQEQLSGAEIYLRKEAGDPR
jgi:hypothetical protein